MEIYKINFLGLNNDETKFMLCTNDGIKTYNIKDLTLTSDSKIKELNLGDISMGAFIRGTNVIAFTGTEGNKEYKNTKIYFIDITSGKKYKVENLINNITDIKSVANYILAVVKEELKVFNTENINNIQMMNSIKLPLNIFASWIKEYKNEDPLISLAIPNENKIELSHYSQRYFIKKDDKIIKTNIDPIQGIFYIKDYIFIVDKEGRNFYSFNVDTGELVHTLYRGKEPGIITSMTLINQNYLAVCNINKTIHIFKLEKPKDIFGYMREYLIKTTTGINSFMKIRFNELVKEENAIFYEKYFTTKGAILSGNEHGNELRIIIYNGLIYKINTY